MSDSRQHVMLMVRELGSGGTERQTTSMAKFLDPSRFRVTIGCMISQGLRRAELDTAGIHIEQFDVPSLKSFQSLKGARHMRRFVREQNVKLVHAFDYPTCVIGPMALRWGMKGVKILTSQRAFRELVPEPWLSLLRRTDRFVDGIVVNSAQLLDAMVKDEKVPRDRLRLVYNAVDASAFPPPANGKRTRPAPVENARLVIGCVAGMRPEKDFPTLLRAMKALSARVDGVHLLLVGSGSEAASLEALRRELGLEGICHFVPQTSNVVPWLHAIDIFVLPSVSEALSNSVMEAMCAECALVVSRIGGNPELVEHGRNGLIFEARQVDQLEACLFRLVNDDEERRRFGATGRQFIESRFSRERSAGDLAKVYDEFLK